MSLLRGARHPSADPGPGPSWCGPGKGAGAAGSPAAHRPSHIQPHQQAWCLPLTLPGPLGRPVQAAISTSHWPEGVGGRNHNWANPGSFSGALSPGQVTGPSGPGFLASNSRRITLPFLPPPPPTPRAHIPVGQQGRAQGSAAPLHAPQRAACRNGLHAPRARPAPPSDVAGTALEGPGVARGTGVLALGQPSAWRGLGLSHPPSP